MNPIFTKSSVEAALNEDDIEIFRLVIEKRFNEHIKLTKHFPNEFHLFEHQYQQYQPYLFPSISILEEKYFTKVTVADYFHISYVKLKNKAILKFFIKKELVLEISMTLKQLDAIIDKYDLDIEETLSSRRYYLVYAGTFLKNDKLIVTSKLQDLKLIKIAYK